MDCSFVDSGYCVGEGSISYFWSRVEGMYS